MDKQRRATRKTSLKLYLNIVFIASIIISVLFTAIFMVQDNIIKSTERIRTEDYWRISQLCKNASYLSQQANNLASNVAFSSQIQSALIQYEYGEKPSLEQLRMQINQSLVYNGQFGSVLYDCVNFVIFSNDGEYIGSKEQYNSNVNLSTFQWFSQLKSSKGQSMWLPLGYDVNGSQTRHTLTIPIVKKIFSTQSSSSNTTDETVTLGKELGYTMTFISLDMFSNLMVDDIDTSTKEFFLVDNNDTVINCKDQKKIGEKLILVDKKNGYVDYSGSDYIKTTKEIKDRNWKYICLTNKTEVNREGMIALRTCIIICVILIFIFSAVGVHITHYIGTPVNILEKYFKRAKEENVSICEGSSILEFDNLFQSFNSTMNQIHDLTNEIYKNKLAHQELITAAKESQIQALQMQINPHFLYNNLDCINWRAQMDGSNDVSIMIQKLGEFFRSNTEITGETTTVKDEIQNIELYISLSSLRFGTRLRCFIDVDEQLYSYSIIKLLLQPFVENSIKYGLEMENSCESIWIWIGEDDGELVVSINDDGVGIDSATLESIRNLWNGMERGYVKTKSIGMYNAMRRLYLCYKNECNFEIFSESGKGTQIVITFPAVKI